MITRKIIPFIFVCLSLVFSIAATRPAMTDSQQLHCYSLLSPVDMKSSGSSKVLESACYNTFSESVKAATKGRVHLDPSVSPKDVTDEMLNKVDGKSLAAAQIVIGVDYDNSNYGGATYTWVVPTSGCTDSIFYSVPTMPNGWENRVSSAKAYSNCNYFYHYRDTNFGTPSVACNTDCSGMGSLDNATSSEKWQNRP